MRRATRLTKKETQHKRRGVSNNPKHAALLKSCREVSREPNLLSDMICVNGTIGAQWELRLALSRTDQYLGHYDVAAQTHVDRVFPPVARPSGSFSNQNWQ
jgi:hypothetical protein